MEKTDVIINRPNFFASERSLVLKTYTFSKDNAQVVTEDGRKIIKHGTVYPSDSASAIGIVYGDVDVTEGDNAGSLMVAGHYLENKLASGSITSEAKTALSAKGLFASTEPEVVRPY